MEVFLPVTKKNILNMLCLQFIFILNILLTSYCNKNFIAHTKIIDAITQKHIL